MWFNGLDKDKYDRQYTDVYLAKRIASYFYGYRKQFVIIVVSFVALSILGALQPVWIADGLTAMAQDGNEFVVIVLIGALLFTAGFQYFVNWVRRYLSAVMIGNVVSRMRKDAFSAAVERDLAFYDNNKSGKIVSRITSDTQEFGDVILIASDVVS
jgi:ABC-type multidrug transport system fused ATPase/permease subunit